VFLRACENREPTLNDNVPGLDGDLDPLGDLEQFLGVAVAQLSVPIVHLQCVGARAAQITAKRPIRVCEIRAAQRFGGAAWMADVHVLHLGGCCGLAM